MGQPGALLALWVLVSPGLLWAAQLNVPFPPAPRLLALNLKQAMPFLQIYMPIDHPLRNITELDPLVDVHLKALGATVQHLPDLKRFQEDLVTYSIQLISHPNEARDLGRKLSRQLQTAHRKASKETLPWVEEEIVRLQDAAAQRRIGMGTILRQTSQLLGFSIYGSTGEDSVRTRLKRIPLASATASIESKNPGAIARAADPEQEIAFAPLALPQAPKEPEGGARSPARSLLSLAPAGNESARQDPAVAEAAAPEGEEEKPAGTIVRKDDMDFSLARIPEPLPAFRAELRRDDSVDAGLLAEIIYASMLPQSAKRYFKIVKHTEEEMITIESPLWGRIFGAEMRLGETISFFYAHPRAYPDAAHWVLLPNILANYGIVVRPAEGAEAEGDGSRFIAQRKVLPPEKAQKLAAH